MAAGQKRNTLVYAQGDYWGHMTARDCGAVGGHMVKRMIEAAERTLSQQAVANVQAGFRAGVASQEGTQNQPNPNLSLNNLDQYY